MATATETMERRFFQLTNVEIREAGEDGRPEIQGYAAVFNSRSVDLGGFVEEIEPGTFRRTLAANPDVRATLEHEGGMTLLGRTRNKSLLLQEDAQGLRVTIYPPDTQAGRDTVTLVRGEYLDQMSFMFRVVKDDWRKDANGQIIRTLRDVELDGGDVSIVTYPAYLATSVSVEARSRATALAAEDGGGADKAQAGKPEARSTHLKHLKRKIEIAKAR